MNTSKLVGFMIYGTEESQRNVFTEDKYRLLAEYCVAAGIAVETVRYTNARAAALRDELQRFDGLLVWVNPIEQGEDRHMLDQLLIDLQRSGVVVSAHPDTIMKIGTKRVLFDTRDMPWGSDIVLYETFEAFRTTFLDSFQGSKIRVLKQYRGDGGNGVFKVSSVDTAPGTISVLHAKRGSVAEVKPLDVFFNDFKHYFDNGKPLINQIWNQQITNGIVRCYMTANKVAGFGYQEINALYPSEDGIVAPGKRYYFTEQCALFADLRQVMEDEWIDALAQRFDLSTNDLPVIWDADFFINEVNTSAQGKYTLCEINVSCVSPFPESAIPKIYAETLRRVAGAA